MFTNQNRFLDATTAFFDTMASALSLRLNHESLIVAPFRQLSKMQVIRLGVEFSVPFGLTLSRMAPGEQQHCGQCSKCRERLEAFGDAGIRDPASYEPIHTRP